MLPKRPKEHILEDKSRDYIKRILPPDWNVETVNDYGIDLHVELVIDNQVTGAHFLMQLKGKNKINRKQGWLHKPAV